MSEKRKYLPAAGVDWLLPIYDPWSRLLGAGKARRVLLDQTNIQPGHRVLDIGCGTGTFAVQVKALHPAVEMIGLDPDPKALARAGRKAERAGVAIQFDQGFADELPYAHASFDHVFSSLMFHHIPRDAKEPTLKEARRVLKPGGSFHMVDLAPHSRGDSFFVRIFHPHGLPDNAEDRIIALMRRSGFSDACRTAQRRIALWRVAYYTAHATG